MKIVVDNFIEKHMLHFTLIALLSVLVYSNTFNVPFQFDDIGFIENNPIIRNLDNFIRLGRGATPVDTSEINNRWLTYFTFALNYRLHGLNVVGFHATNLLIHIINAILVYWLILLTVQTPLMERSRLAAENARLARYVALFAALLFAAHPIQTQAVTYIYQRLASLATLFYLLALVAYIKARLTYQAVDGRGWRSEEREQGVGDRGTKTDTGNGLFNGSSVFWYLVSLLSAFLAMKTKEISFTLPVVIALHELMFFKGNLKKIIIGLGPLFVTMLIVPLVYLDINKPVGELINNLDTVTRVQTKMPRLDYLFTQFRVIVTYLRLLIIPVDQNLDYDYPVYHSFFDLEVLFSFLFLLTFLCSGLYLVYRVRGSARTQGNSHQNQPPDDYRMIGFGIFWFFITLTIESSVIPIVDVIFEHRVYLPSVGFFIALTTTVFLITDKYVSRRASVFKAVVLAFSAVTVVYSVAAYTRNGVWRDEITLLNDVVKKTPLKTRVYYLRGIVYDKKGNTSKALEDFNTILSLDSSKAEAYNSRGVCRMKQGAVDAAISDFSEALRLNAYYIYNNHEYRYRYNRGTAFIQKGAYDQALEDFTAAIKQKPRYYEAFNNRSFVYYKKGQYDRALEDVNRSLFFNKDCAEAYDSRGNIYRKMGRRNESISDFQKACDLGVMNSCEALK